MVARGWPVRPGDHRGVLAHTVVANYHWDTPVEVGLMTAPPVAMVVVVEPSAYLTDGCQLKRMLGRIAGGL